VGEQNEWVDLEPQRKRMRPFPLAKMREPPEAERHFFIRLFMKIFSRM
jgi:hypothetical protein